MHSTGLAKAVKTILAAWTVAGTMDITSALIYAPLKYNITRTELLQYIASGVFGEKAFTGGTAMAIWGLAFHYCIAFFWTIIFFFIYPKIMMQWRNRIVTGILYGIFVWLVMNLIVLPLSNVHRPQFNFIQAVIGAVFLMCCIGIPNAIIVGRYYSKLIPPGTKGKSEL
jgi:uncharacterized membrane protein YagU involved in acid resistance